MTNSKAGDTPRTTEWFGISGVCAARIQIPRNATVNNVRLFED
jgi:hypothetical protein